MHFASAPFKKRNTKHSGEVWQIRAVFRLRDPIARSLTRNVLWFLSLDLSGNLVICVTSLGIEAPLHTVPNLYAH